MLNSQAARVITSVLHHLSRIVVLVCFDDVVAGFNCFDPGPCVTRCTLIAAARSLSLAHNTSLLYLSLHPRPHHASSHETPPATQHHLPPPPSPTSNSLGRSGPRNRSNNRPIPTPPLCPHPPLHHPPPLHTIHLPLPHPRLPPHALPPLHPRLVARHGQMAYALVWSPALR